MTERLKETGMIMSVIACVALAISGRAMDSEVLMNMAYSFGGIFGAIVGFPFVGKGISKLVK